MHDFYTTYIKVTHYIKISLLTVSFLIKIWSPLVSLCGLLMVSQIVPNPALVSLTSIFSASTWPNVKSKVSFEILRTSRFQNDHPFWIWWRFEVVIAKIQKWYFFLWTRCMSLVTTALSSAQHHGFHCTGLSQQKIISRSPRQWPHNLRGCSRFHSPQRQKALHVICPKIETHLDHPLIRILLQFSVKYWARKLQEQIKLTHFLQLISLSRWLYLHLQLKQVYISRGYQKSTFFSRESDSTTPNVRPFVCLKSKPPNSSKSIISPYHYLQHHSHHHPHHHRHLHTQHHTPPNSSKSFISPYHYLQHHSHRHSHHHRHLHTQHHTYKTPFHVTTYSHSYHQHPVYACI